MAWIQEQNIFNSSLRKTDEEIWVGKIGFHLHSYKNTYS